MKINPTKARRTQKRNGYKGVQVRKDKRLAIYLRDGFRCVWCGVDLHSADPFNVTLDHLVPRKTGGNGWRNLVTACRSCNCSRQDEQWQAFAGTDECIKSVLAKICRPLQPYRDLAKAILGGECGKLFQ